MTADWKRPKLQTRIHCRTGKPMCGNRERWIVENTIKEYAKKSIYEKGRLTTYCYVAWGSNIMKWQMITTKSEPILIGLLWSGINGALIRFERGWRSWRNRKVMLLVDRERFSLYACRTYYYDTWSNEYFLYSKCFCLLTIDEAIMKWYEPLCLYHMNGITNWMKQNEEALGCTIVHLSVSIRFADGA